MASAEEAVPEADEQYGGEKQGRGAGLITARRYHRAARAAAA
jgi:hypothetical protein